MSPRRWRTSLAMAAATSRAPRSPSTAASPPDRRPQPPRVTHKKGIDMSAITNKAVVLSGGGFAGGAWMLGLIDSLADRGVDLGDADLIVGTSAGARTG